MAHNIYQEKFVSYKEPAWHQLGHVCEEPLSAMEAYLLAKPFTVDKQALQTVGGLPVSHMAIVRDNQEILGIVGKDYGLITPASFVEQWDQKVGAPIETYGVLGNGDTVFVTTKLPNYEVKGDEVENYILALSPMNGREAASIRISPVRVVCQNTLIAAKRRSTEVYKIMHDAKAVERFGGWLESVWGKAKMKAETLRDAFEILASAQVRGSEVPDLVNQIYEAPTKPDTDDLQTLATWDRKTKQVQAIQEKVYNLFEGKGTG